MQAIPAPSPMPIFRIFLTTLLVLAASAVLAGNNNLLIQLEPDGRYKIWHGDGETHLGDEELVDLWNSATPEGGPVMGTSVGPATAVATPRGVLASLPNAPRDKSLLIDRDDCGAVKVWHATGPTTLSEEQLTELMLTALPDGGKPLPVGDRLARAYTTRVGVVVLIWKPVKR